MDEWYDLNYQNINSMDRLYLLLRFLEAATEADTDVDYKLHPLLRFLEAAVDVAYKPPPIIIAPKHAEHARSLILNIEGAAKRIFDRLNNNWRDGGDDALSADQAIHVWPLGTVTFIIEQHPILRGVMELRRSEPIAAGLTKVVSAFLLAIPGLKDKLTRENHGPWGYHYHYLDSKDRRSNTLLTFDEKSANVDEPNLYWERHAEKYKFKARAEMWGLGKCESVYSVCHPDTKRFKLRDFKSPKSDAMIVWPLQI